MCCPEMQHYDDDDEHRSEEFKASLDLSRNEDGNISLHGALARNILDGYGPSTGRLLLCVFSHLCVDRRV